MAGWCGVNWGESGGREAGGVGSSGDPPGSSTKGLVGRGSHGSLGRSVPSAVLGAFCA